MALEVSFVRHRERRDHIYVARSDGTTAGWEFPSYGDDLPHDLCHLVVEDALGFASGFWGLVDLGADVKLIDNQAVLVRNGLPLIEYPNVDFHDLNKAEQAVALLDPIGTRSEKLGGLAVVRHDPTSSAALGGDSLRSELGFELPEGTSEEMIAGIRERLNGLRREWRDLDDGGAIILTYSRNSTR